MEMIEEGGEELEEETWLEEMKPGMVLFRQVQTFQADFPLAPASFSGFPLYPHLVRVFLGACGLTKNPKIV